MDINKATILTGSHDCDDCHAEAETVPASYLTADGAKVCDSHLDIRAEA